MKDGIWALTVTIPWNRPTAMPMRIVSTRAGRPPTPAPYSRTKVRLQSARTEPTERSNSPAIISTPTARAMMPNSAWVARKISMLSLERK